MSFEGAKLALSAAFSFASAAAAKSDLPSSKERDVRRSDAVTFELDTFEGYFKCLSEKEELRWNRLLQRHCYED